jgi:hypothetical protein
MVLEMCLFCGFVISLGADAADDSHPWPAAAMIDCFRVRKVAKKSPECPISGFYRGLGHSRRPVHRTSAFGAVVFDAWFVNKVTFYLTFY